MTDPTTAMRNQWQARLTSAPAAFLLDLLFPPRCVRCGRVDETWCPRCQQELAAVPMVTIKRELPPLVSVAATGWHTGLLQTLVQALKYEEARSIAAPLGQRMVTRFQQEKWSPDGVAAVPLHTVRLQERGYNQSKLLAQQVAELLGKPDYSNFIIRDRYTRSQVGLNRGARQQNVMGAFHAQPIVANKRLLLVDDVFTTGATLRACAEALVASGASAVYGLTVTAAA